MPVEPRAVNITWQNFNLRAEISAQVAQKLNFNPGVAHNPGLKIPHVGRAEIPAQSTGLSSTLGLKMLHVIKPLDDISYLQELEKVKN